MTADPRAALAQLVSALERHLEVASTRRDPDDPAVIAAAEALAEAFDDYDETLFAATEVATPLAVYGDMDDDEDYEDDDVDPRDAAAGDSAVYAGLDDEDVDFEDEDDDGNDEDDDEDDEDDDGNDEDEGDDEQDR